MILAQTKTPLCQLCSRADPNIMHSFYEFFAGGGMARVGLGPTSRLLELMEPLHLAKVEEARRGGRRVVGAICRRMRQGQQRAEGRFDGVAPALRSCSTQEAYQLTGDGVVSPVVGWLGEHLLAPLLDAAPYRAARPVAGHV